jgi:hypothetical protein
MDLQPGCMVASMESTQPHVMPSLKKQLLNSTTFPANRHRLLLYGKLESQDTLFLWALIAEHPP